jgi:hypothetical protein
MENLHFTYDLRLTQGDDRSIVMVFEDDAGTPAPVEIDGWEFLYTAKRVHDTSVVDATGVFLVEDATIFRSLTGVGVTYDTITIPIDKAQTDLVVPGNYLHEVQRTVTGKDDTIMKGTLVVDPQVTNRSA